MTQKNVYYDTVSIIKDTESLSSFVYKTMQDKNLSARAVETASNGKITHSYVNKIKNGYAKKVSTPLLQALATGLGEPEEIIFSLVRGKKIDQEIISNERFSELSEKYSKLNAEQREMVEPFLAAFEKTIDRFSETHKDGPPVMTIEELNRSRKSEKSAK